MKEKPRNALHDLCAPMNLRWHIRALKNCELWNLTPKHFMPYTKTLSPRTPAAPPSVEGLGFEFGGIPTLNPETLQPPTWTSNVPNIMAQSFEKEHQRPLLYILLGPR